METTIQSAPHICKRESIPLSLVKINIPTGSIRDKGYGISDYNSGFKLIRLEKHRHKLLSAVFKICGVERIGYNEKSIYLVYQIFVGYHVLCRYRCDRHTSPEY